MHNVDECIERLKRCEILPQETVHELCDTLKGMLVYESNVQHIRAPVTVVGNIHGQFWDLLELFRIGGQVPDTNYIFLGSYIDFGYYGVETLSLLVALKIRYPERIYLLRGSHESAPMTEVYGFYQECMQKYGTSDVWKDFVDIFPYFTTCAVVENKTFCIHGGLASSLTTLDQIRVLDRFKELSKDTPLQQLIWNDPDREKEGFHPSSKGPGFAFGGDVVAKFLETNNLDHIVRSHQLCLDGYQFIFGGALTTIWSAPNFAGKSDNVASICEINEELKRYLNTFLAAPVSERQEPLLTGMKEVPDYFC